MPTALNVLALFAHPDDAEFLAAGTLLLLGERGAKIHLATMTAGDCGSTILSPAKISRIRRREAQNAAQLAGASYTCLGEKDLKVFYDRRTVEKVMELVRRVDPALVLTHSPADYMADHETTSRLCQTACFGAMAPNFLTGARRHAKAIRAIPHLYYAQPFGGRDILGTPIHSKVFVDITNVLARKEQMLACHESQNAFLDAQQEIRDTLALMRQMAARAGKECGFERAEGFRQHMGQGFPQDDLLGQLLDAMVHRIET